MTDETDLLYYAQIKAYKNIKLQLKIRFDQRFDLSNPFNQRPKNTVVH